MSSVSRMYLARGAWNTAPGSHCPKKNDHSRPTFSCLLASPIPQEASGPVDETHGRALPQSCEKNAGWMEGPWPWSQDASENHWL